MCCGGCDRCGAIVGSLLYTAQKITVVFVTTAVAACLVVSLIMAGGVGVGIGYHYCIVESRTIQLDFQAYRNAYMDKKSEGSTKATPIHPTEHTGAGPTNPTRSEPTGPTIFHPTNPTESEPTGTTTFYSTNPTGSKPTGPTSFHPTNPTRSEPTGPTTVHPTNPTGSKPTGTTTHHSTESEPTGPTTFHSTRSESRNPTGLEPTNPTTSHLTTTSYKPNPTTSAGRFLMQRRGNKFLTEQARKHEKYPKSNFRQTTDQISDDYQNFENEEDEEDSFIKRKRQGEQTGTMYNKLRHILKNKIMEKPLRMKRMDPVVALINSSV